MYLHIPALETVLLLNSRKDGIGGHTNILYQGWKFPDGFEWFLFEPRTVKRVLNQMPRW